MSYNKEPSPEMLINTVDSKDHVIGVIQRKKVLQSHQSFRVAHVFVFNSKEELLLQKISKKNKRHPFYWGSSVAGYLFAGESYTQGANRRIKQELGIEPRLSFFGKVTMKEETGDKIIGLYICHYNKEIYPNKELILDTKFYALQKIKKMLDGGDIKVTPTFSLLFNFFYTRKQDK